MVDFLEYQSVCTHRFFFFTKNMARSKESKKAVTASLAERLDRSKSVIFANFQGLKVKETEELRKICAAENSECIMAKKTLFSIALKERGLDEIDPRSLEGEVAAVFGYGDEVAPARLLANFGKSHEALGILSGLILSAPAGSRALDARSVKSLASLPSRDELLAKAVGSLAQPMRGMVGVLQGNLRGLVYALNAIAEAKK